MSTPRKSPPAAAKRDRSTMVNPNKKNREAAKAAATEAFRKLNARKAPRPSARAAAIATADEAIRALARPAPPAAAEPPTFHLEKPGDPEPYVLTLRITRGHARKLRIVAAHSGHKFPAQWVIEHLERELKRELDAIEQRGGRT